MSLESTLNWTADIVPNVTSSYSEHTYPTALYSGVKTRREESTRFVRDKNGSEILASHLFFFLKSEVATLEIDWAVRFMGVDYIVIKADMLSDLVNEHHWECWVK